MPAYRASSVDAHTAVADATDRVTHYLDFNSRRHSGARHRPSLPYPTAQNVWERSAGPNEADDDFRDLYMADFLNVSKRTARHKLRNIRPGRHLDELLARGVARRLEGQDGHSDVLESAVGYSAAMGTMLLEDQIMVESKVRFLVISWFDRVY